MDCCLEIPGYFTSQRQAEHLRRLRREFPFVYIHELTRTAYGRPIHALQIGSGDRKILLTAGHHANETITSEVLWRFLFTYCKALRAERTVCGADALSLYHEAMVYLVPLVNPDGADLAAGAIAPGSAEYCAAAQIAAGFPDVPFPSGWKANLSGVDLNLNYPARWEEARSIKAAKGFGRPAPRDYPGGRPLDQPETAALAAYAACIRPDLMLALHTQGRVIYPGPVETAPEGSEALAKHSRRRPAMRSKTSRQNPPTRASRTGFCSGSTARRSPWNVGLGKIRCRRRRWTVCARSCFRCSSPRYSGRRMV